MECVQPSRLGRSWGRADRRTGRSIRAHLRVVDRIADQSVPIICDAKSHGSVLTRALALVAELVLWDGRCSDRDHGRSGNGHWLLNTTGSQRRGPAPVRSPSGRAGKSDNQSRRQPQPKGATGFRNRILPFYPQPSSRPLRGRCASQCSPLWLTWRTRAGARLFFARSRAIP
jgi:hypothetical protein